MDDEANPLPSDETTPPVTKMNLVRVLVNSLPHFSSVSLSALRPAPTLLTNPKYNKTLQMSNRDDN